MGGDLKSFLYPLKIVSVIVLLFSGTQALIPYTKKDVGNRAMTLLIVHIICPFPLCSPMKELCREVLKCIIQCYSHCNILTWHYDKALLDHGLIMRVFIVLGTIKQKKNNIELVISGVWLAAFNSVANPFVYAILMPTYRRCVIKTFWPCANKSKPEEKQKGNSSNTISSMA